MLRRQDFHHEVKVDKPKLQVLSIKKIASNNADPKKPERYRMQLSDGEKKHSSSILATQLNHLIIDNGIQENGIIQLDQYISNTVDDHHIIIILGVTVVSGPTDLIGNPTPVDQAEPAVAVELPPCTAAFVDDGVVLELCIERIKIQVRVVLWHSRGASACPPACGLPCADVALGMPVVTAETVGFPVASVAGFLSSA